MFCPRWGGGARGGPRSPGLAQADRPLAGQFGTVRADDGVGPAALTHHQPQLPHHAQTAQGSIHHGRQTLAAEVVQYAQHPEVAAVGQRVGHEVEGPALIESDMGGPLLDFDAYEWSSS